jgi:tetratricopeptide (TPR) repeat protein
MNNIKQFGVLLAILLLVSCDNKKTEKPVDRFPGFVQIGSDNEATSLYLDVKSIKKNDNGALFFKMLRIITTGYAIQDAKTNCRDAFLGLPGVKFTNDGVSDNEYPGDTDVIAFRENKPIFAIVNRVCKEAGVSLIEVQETTNEDEKPQPPVVTDKSESASETEVPNEQPIPVTQDFSTKDLIKYSSDATQFVLQMIESAKDTDKLMSAKSGLDGLVKPVKGDRLKARKLNDLAIALIKESKDQDALPLLEEAHKTDPTDVEITNNLASTYSRIPTSENFDPNSKTKSMLVETLLLKSDRAIAWANLGRSFANEGNEKAATYCYINFFNFAENKDKALIRLQSGTNETHPVLGKAMLNAYDYVKTRVASVTNTKDGVNCVRTEPYIPQGWCQPTQADFSADWLEYKKSTPIPYHASGRFNNDNELDEAWILFDQNRKNWGVFVFLKENEQEYKFFKIEENMFIDIKPQAVQINASDPGVIETACGKGYWECSKDEQPKLDLKLNGLTVGPFDHGGTIIVYWENGKFKKISLDD